MLFPSYKSDYHYTIRSVMHYQKYVQFFFSIAFFLEKLASFNLYILNANLVV